MILLESEAEKLRTSMQAKLESEIARDALLSSNDAVFWTKLQEKWPEQFQAEFDRFDAAFRSQCSRAFSLCQQRSDLLIQLVRKTAAEAFAIPDRVPVAEGTLEFRRTPYWVTAPRETLVAIPHNAIERLLPHSVRVRRVERRLKEAIDHIVRRNVENLRWSIKQDLEEEFRRFALRFEEQLTAALSATREAAMTVFQQRQHGELQFQAEMECLLAASRRLTAIEDELGLLV